MRIVARSLFCFFTVAAVLLSRFAWSDAYPFDQSEEINLHQQLYYLEDISTQLGIEQIHAEQSNWQLNGDEEFSHGYSNSAWWFKLTLKNPSSEEQFRFVELGYAILDFVDIYVLRGDQLIETFKTGDRRQYAARPIDSENFVVPLRWEPGETLNIYYRIKTGSALQVPVKLWQPTAFYTYENESNIAHGLYYGGMVVIAIYNLMIFLLLWDRSYLYYVGFVLSSPLLFLSISGQGYRYLWTDLIEWNSISLPLSIASLVLFGALFTRQFMGLKKVSIALDRMILSFAVLGGTMFVLSIFLPYKTAILILIPTAALACIADMIAGSVAWYRGVDSARFYLLAWSCFLLATVAMALQKVDLLPKIFVMEYAVQVGSILEAVLLSFALAERINMERRLRFEAQTETIDTARRLNKELEQRVEERTAELEEANKRLEKLSNTDQLTQIFNRRYLEQLFANEWTRCQRYNHHLAVLLIDVDHFKAVNDEHGHPAGDACLVEIAKIMQASLRVPADIVARFGGEEFCVLLPETDPEAAGVVAERMREAIKELVIKADGHTFKVTISVGVCSQIPHDKSSVDDMLSCADKALYLSKYSGRDRVTFFNSDSAVIPLKKTKDESSAK